MSQKPVILTGLRANNNLHIGNYFGAIKPVVDMSNQNSDEYKINLFLPDLHSFTTPIDHTKLKEQVIETARVFIAAGLNTEDKDVNIYRQSYVSAHSELTWILSCFTGTGELSRMTQYKEKQTETTSAGLFNYPVLMAADILLYGAKYVPVGDDQTQHLEFTRDIAVRMNNKFGELFIVPEPVKKQHEFFGKDQGLRIRDLADPTKKMSKSDQSEKGVIFLTDSPETATKKIMSATTDSFENIQYDYEKSPGVTNLLDLLSLTSGKNKDEVINQYSGEKTYGALKQEVAKYVGQFLSEFNKKLESVSTEKALEMLEIGEKTVEPQAKATLLKVQKAVGLR